MNRYAAVALFACVLLAGCGDKYETPSELSARMDRIVGQMDKKDGELERKVSSLERKITDLELRVQQLEMFPRR